MYIPNRIKLFKFLYKKTQTLNRLAIKKTDHPNPSAENFTSPNGHPRRFKFTNMADVFLGACRFEVFSVTAGGGWRVNPASGSTTPGIRHAAGCGGVGGDGGGRIGGWGAPVADRCSASHAASPRSTRISNFNPLVNDGLGVVGFNCIFYGPIGKGCNFVFSHFFQAFILIFFLCILFFTCGFTVYLQVLKVTDKIY